MADPVIVAGPYQASFGGQTFVYTTEEGFKYVAAVKDRPIKSDVRGDEEIDGIFTGVMWTVEFTAIEWDAAKFAQWMKEKGAATPVGTLIKSLAGALVLTPTSPATETYTFHKAYPLGDKEALFRSTQEKRMPFLFKCYPDLAKSEGEMYMSIT